MSLTTPKPGDGCVNSARNGLVRVMLTWFGTGWPCGLCACTSGEDLEISETFIRDNYEQLSFSEYELRHRKVGILGTMFPLTWRSPRLNAETSAGPERALLSDRMQTTAALLLVLYDPRRRAPDSEGDFLGIMSLGCVLENMWLVAASLEIGFQAISTFTNSSVEHAVKSVLSIPPQLRIAFGVRLGVSARSARSASSPQGRGGFHALR